ncbi:isochorismatase family protein [Shewanella marina]|uniref:isochorismatase family protein n=1 Tax=Shewanella marina TaxID=487319 RepID=UPI000471462F|nr:isochorismatase family protein [Shewanella marina]
MKNVFSGKNAAMLLIDHQVGTMGWVRSAELSLIEVNTLVLAKAAKAIDMPLILTSSQEDQAQGLLFDDLQKAVPEEYANRIQRAGIVDCMMDDEFATAVGSTGRKKLLMAGITTDVCVVYPALTAIENGYDVQVIVDACGSPSAIADQIALQRMAKAGVTLTTTNQLIAELAQDWSSEDGEKLVGILYQDIISKM